MDSGPPGPADDLLALQASEARLRKIIAHNADGMVLVCPRGVIRFVNPAAEQLLGRRADRLLGQAFGIPVVPGKATEVDIVPLPGGEPRTAELRVVEIDWEGEPAYLASLRDITERKQMEEELQRRAAQLAEADHRKDEFLAMLAHELRNPLGPIRSALHLMQQAAGSKAQVERARTVAEGQVQHLARLVDDLLDVSRITRGKIRLCKKAVDLGESVDRVALAHRPLLEERGQTLTCTRPGEQVLVEADGVRLEQVLGNLLHNARKYTPAGGRVWVSAGREGDEAVLRVRDNGMGIAPDMCERIFDLFTQVEKSLDRSHSGLGIGLTLVRSLVQMHGGSVVARSAGPGQGCEFIVRLPALANEAPPAADAAGPSAPPRALARRVLVVEDQEDAAEMLAALLRVWGHEVRVAPDGPAALAAAGELRPEVVLLDLGLPGMTGFEVAERLRALPGMETARLVALTGYGQEEARRRCQAVGFHQHLLKPVDPEHLRALLAQPPT
jgi:signal transduction histidine kinase